MSGLPAKMAKKRQTNWLAGRPMLPMALGLALGSAIGVETEWQWDLALATLLLIFLSFATLRKALRKTPTTRDALFLTLFCLCSVAGGAFNASVRHEGFKKGGDECSLRGVVTRVMRDDSTRLRIVVKTDTLTACVEVDRRKVPGAQGEIWCGDSVRIDGTTADPRQDVFSSFDYGDYLESQGISMLVECREMKTAEARGWGAATLAGKVGQWYSGRLDAMGVSLPNAAFLRALMLGDRSGLPRGVSESFSACGTSHVLAVSGLHVGVLAWVVSFALSLVAGRRVAAAATIVVLWFYALMVGMSPSVVRASIMFTFIEIGRWQGRPFPVFHSLTAALAAILLFDPLSVSSIGLWLSFAAVGGLLAAMPTVNRVVNEYVGERIQNKACAKAAKWVATAVAVSAVAQFSTTPIIAYTFHSFPTWFWLNNLLVVPLIWVVFNATLLGTVVASVPGVGPGAGWFVDHALTLLTDYCSWAAQLPMAQVDCGAKSIVVLTTGTIFVVLTLAWVAMRGRELRRAWCAAFATLLVAILVNDLGRSPSVNLLTVYGRLSVAVSDGRTTRLLMSDASHGASLKAAKRWADREGIKIGSARNMRDVEIVEHDGTRIAILNANDATAAGCDIVVVNHDGLPCGAEEDDGCLYVLSPACDLPAAWRRAKKRVERLEVSGLWAVEPCSR